MSNPTPFEQKDLVSSTLNNLDKSSNDLIAFFDSYFSSELTKDVEIIREDKTIEKLAFNTVKQNSDKFWDQGTNYYFQSSGERLRQISDSINIQIGFTDAKRSLSDDIFDLLNDNVVDSDSDVESGNADLQAASGLSNANYEALHDLQPTFYPNPPFTPNPPTNNLFDRATTSFTDFFNLIDVSITNLLMESADDFLDDANGDGILGDADTRAYASANVFGNPTINFDFPNIEDLIDDGDNVYNGTLAQYTSGGNLVTYDQKELGITDFYYLEGIKTRVLPSEGEDKRIDFTNTLWRDSSSTQAEIYRGMLAIAMTGQASVEINPPLQSTDTFDIIQNKVRQANLATMAAAEEALKFQVGDYINTFKNWYDEPVATREAIEEFDLKVLTDKDDDVFVPDLKLMHVNTVTGEVEEALGTFGAFDPNTNPMNLAQFVQANTLDPILGTQYSLTAINETLDNWDGTKPAPAPAPDPNIQQSIIDLYSHSFMYQSLQSRFASDSGIATKDIRMHNFIQEKDPNFNPFLIQTVTTLPDGSSEFGSQALFGDFLTWEATGGFPDGTADPNGTVAHLRGDNQFEKITDMFLEQFDIRSARYVEDNRTLVDLFTGNLSQLSGDNTSLNDTLFASMRDVTGSIQSQTRNLLQRGIEDSLDNDFMMSLFDSTAVRPEDYGAPYLPDSWKNTRENYEPALYSRVIDPSDADYISSTYDAFTEEIILELIDGVWTDPAPSTARAAVQAKLNTVFPGGITSTEALLLRDDPIGTYQSYKLMSPAPAVGSIEANVITFFEEVVLDKTIDGAPLSDLNLRTRPQGLPADFPFMDLRDFNEFFKTLLEIGEKLGQPPLPGDPTPADLNYTFMPFDQVSTEANAKMELRLDKLEDIINNLEVRAESLERTVGSDQIRASGLPYGAGLGNAPDATLIKSFLDNHDETANHITKRVLLDLQSFADNVAEAFVTSGTYASRDLAFATDPVLQSYAATDLFASGPGYTALDVDALYPGNDDQIIDLATATLTPNTQNFLNNLRPTAGEAYFSTAAPDPNGIPVPNPGDISFNEFFNNKLGAYESLDGTLTGGINIDIPEIPNSIAAFKTEEEKIDFMIGLFAEYANFTQEEAYKSVFASQQIEAGKINARTTTKKLPEVRADGSVPEDDQIPTPYVYPSSSSLLVGQVGNILMEKVNEMVSDNEIVGVSLNATSDTSNNRLDALGVKGSTGNLDFSSLNLQGSAETKQYLKNILKNFQVVVDPQTAFQQMEQTFFQRLEEKNDQLLADTDNDNYAMVYMDKNMLQQFKALKLYLDKNRSVISSGSYKEENELRKYLNNIDFDKFNNGYHVFGKLTNKEKDFFKALDAYYADPTNTDARLFSFGGNNYTIGDLFGDPKNGITKSTDFFFNQGTVAIDSISDDSLPPGGVTDIGDFATDLRDSLLDAYRAGEHPNQPQAGGFNAVPNSISRGLLEDLSDFYDDLIASLLNDGVNNADLKDDALVKTFIDAGFADTNGLNRFNLILLANPNDQFELDGSPLSPLSIDQETFLLNLLPPFLKFGEGADAVSFIDFENNYQVDIFNANGISAYDDITDTNANIPFKKHTGNISEGSPPFEFEDLLDNDPILKAIEDSKIVEIANWLDGEGLSISTDNIDGNRTAIIANTSVNNNVDINKAINFLKNLRGPNARFSTKSSGFNQTDDVRFSHFLSNQGNNLYRNINNIAGLSIPSIPGSFANLSTIPSPSSTFTIDSVTKNLSDWLNIALEGDDGQEGVPLESQYEGRFTLNSLITADDDSLLKMKVGFASGATDPLTRDDVWNRKKYIRKTQHVSELFGIISGVEKLKTGASEKHEGYGFNGSGSAFGGADDGDRVKVGGKIFRNELVDLPNSDTDISAAADSITDFTSYFSQVDKDMVAISNSLDAQMKKPKNIPETEINSTMHFLNQLDDQFITHDLNGNVENDESYETGLIQIFGTRKILDATATDGANNGVSKPFEGDKPTNAVRGDYKHKGYKANLFYLNKLGSDPSNSGTVTPKQPFDIVAMIEAEMGFTATQNLIDPATTLDPVTNEIPMNPTSGAIVNSDVDFSTLYNVPPALNTRTVQDFLYAMDKVYEEIADSNLPGAKEQLKQFDTWIENNAVSRVAVGTLSGKDALEADINILNAFQESIIYDVSYNSINDILKDTRIFMSQKQDELADLYTFDADFKKLALLIEESETSSSVTATDVYDYFKNNIYNSANPFDGVPRSSNNRPIQDGTGLTQPYEDLLYDLDILLEQYRSLNEDGPTPPEPILNSSSQREVTKLNILQLVQGGPPIDSLLINAADQEALNNGTSLQFTVSGRTGGLFPLRTPAPQGFPEVNIVRATRDFRIDLRENMKPQESKAMDPSEALGQDLAYEYVDPNTGDTILTPRLVREDASGIKTNALSINSIINDGATDVRNNSVKGRSIQELLLLMFVLQMFEQSKWDFEKYINDPTRYQ